MLRILRGRYRARSLALPPRELVRPMGQRMRETVFNILEHRFHMRWEESVVLDAFAGSGSLGMEALSRDARKVYFVEKNPAICTFLHKNTSSDTKAHVMQADATRSYTLPEKADLIFIDPPFGKDMVPLGLQCALEHAHSTTIVILQKETGIPFQCPDAWTIETQRTQTYKTVLFLKRLGD